MNKHLRKSIPGVDKKLLVKDAAKLMPDPIAAAFLRGGASLGALTLLTGCDIVDSYSAESVLAQMSKFNDRVQAALFNPNTLAPTFPESAITRPFPFNAYYTDRRGAGGRRRGPTSSKSQGLSKTRSRGRWMNSTRCRRTRRSRGISASRAGARSAVGPACALGDFLTRIGADTRAKYVWFQLRRGLLPRPSTCRRRCIRRRS